MASARLSAAAKSFGVFDGASPSAEESRKGQAAQQDATVDICFSRAVITSLVGMPGSGTPAAFLRGALDLTQ